LGPHLFKEKRGNKEKKKNRTSAKTPKKTINTNERGERERFVRRTVLCKKRVVVIFSALRTEKGGKDSVGKICGWKILERGGGGRGSAHKLTMCGTTSSRETDDPLLFR